tara:strand:- start:668 stop:811 length:144 start_codon:yes stop_codon:yes gene_type:complete
MLSEQTKDKNNVPINSPKKSRRAQNKKALQTLTDPRRALRIYKSFNK